MADHNRKLNVCIVCELYGCEEIALDGRNVCACHAAVTIEAVAA